MTAAAIDFSRPEKGARGITGVPAAIRILDRHWGTQLADRMIDVAKRIVENPSADVETLTDDVRKTRREAVIREGRALARMALEGIRVVHVDVERQEPCDECRIGIVSLVTDDYDPEGGETLRAAGEGERTCSACGAHLCPDCALRHIDDDSAAEPA